MVLKCPPRSTPTASGMPASMKPATIARKCAADPIMPFETTSASKSSPAACAARFATPGSCLPNPGSSSSPTSMPMPGEQTSQTWSGPSPATGS